MIKVDRNTEEVFYAIIPTSDSSEIEIKYDKTLREKVVKICIGMRSIEIPVTDFLEIADEIHNFKTKP